LLLTFLFKNFVLPKQLKFKHAKLERYTVSLQNDIFPEVQSSCGHLSSKGLFLAYIEIDMDTTGMGMLVISAYIRYGAVLFKSAIQLKLFPETKKKPFE